MKNIFSRRHLQSWTGVVFILLVPTIAHILFSQLGFNPTDDGLILAGSRRILDGQIPHLDFISIRTPGSYFFHVPAVFLGGDYTLWISRYFAWFQFACIAWAWTAIVSHSLRVFQSMVEKSAFALIGFCFSVHCFPIMVWHTVDALFIASVGTILCYKQSNLMKILGYLIIGMSPLFRQSFLPLIPVSIMVFGDWRKKRYWLAASLPLALYVGYVVINGAVSDAVVQLTTYSYKELLWSGVGMHIAYGATPWGILLGCLATFAVHGKLNLRPILTNNMSTRMMGILVLFGLVLIAACSLALHRWYYYLWYYMSFVVFGAVIGATISFIYMERKATPLIQCGVLVLIVAWSVSLSIGYTTPSLAAGPLVLFLIACGKLSFEDNRELHEWEKTSILQRFLQRHMRTCTRISTTLLLIGILIAFGVARETYVYREMPAPFLIYDLGEVLPGGKLVKTNHNTYLFLEDLQVARNIAKDEGKEYAIIPDVAANWIKSLQANPLSSDWPQNVELGSKELVDRIIRDLEGRRGNLIVIVQKYEAYLLDTGFTPLSDGYHIVQYVRSNWSKTGETGFFELYE